MSDDDDGGLAMMTQQPPGLLSAPREGDGLALTQQVEAVAADVPPPPVVGFYLKAQSTSQAYEGSLVSCQFRREANHDGYPVSKQLVLARSPRQTVDQNAVCEVQVDGCSIPALLVVDPPEVIVGGLSYQIVLRQHALVEHRPVTDDLKLTAMGGDVLLNRRSKGATPAWQLVKKGNSTTFSYCTTIYVGHRLAHLTSNTCCCYLHVVARQGRPCSSGSWNHRRSLVVEAHLVGSLLR